MNDSDLLPASKIQPRRPPASPQWPEVPEPPHGPGRRGGAGRRLFGLAVLAVVVAALAFGAWRHFQQSRDVAATAEQQAAFMPSVRVEQVVQRHGRLHVSLPGTTLAFEQADIYARASGYVLKRNVDIGDHVKTGQLLAEITAPEVDHQIAQFQNSVQQFEQTTQQNAANRSLAQVTLGRDSVLVKHGRVTQQQRDTDRYSYQAQQHAAQAAGYNAEATKAQLEATNQQKIYQQVVAPFDGVVKQRNIDVGRLITADAKRGTSMFSMVHRNVIRDCVSVPLDGAFGVCP